MPASILSPSRAGDRKRIEALMAQGASLNEIFRTTGSDYRTVRRLDPNYKPFPVGGGGDAQIIRQVNQDLKRIDSTGHMSTRRGRA